LERKPAGRKHTDAIKTQSLTQSLTQSSLHCKKPFLDLRVAATPKSETFHACAPAMAGTNFPAIPTVSALLRALKTPALKRLGQNFLLDANLTGELLSSASFRLSSPFIVADKFVKSAGSLVGAHVLEIGPGPGSLTRSILKVSEY
jgi:hypothetical protein